jgi:hypothetical protein
MCKSCSPQEWEDKTETLAGTEMCINVTTQNQVMVFARPVPDRDAIPDRGVRTWPNRP